MSANARDDRWRAARVLLLATPLLLGLPLLGLAGGAADGARRPGVDPSTTPPRRGRGALRAQRVTGGLVTARVADSAATAPMKAPTAAGAASTPVVVPATGQTS